jgi:hypothetical protein
MRRTCRGAVGFLAAAAICAAQAADSWSKVEALAPRTEVRIAIAKSRSVTGSLERVTDANLTVNAGGRARTIDRPQITRVLVRTPPRRKRSALIGLAIGAGGGAALGGGLAAACVGKLCGGHGAEFVAGGAAGGAIIGVLIGAAVSHAGWREAYRQ